MPVIYFQFAKPEWQWVLKVNEKPTVTRFGTTFIVIANVMLCMYIYFSMVKGATVRENSS